MALRPWLDLRRSLRPGHAPVLALVPLGLIVTVCVVDVLAPPHIHLGPLLVAAPAITVAFAGARVTALMGALAVAAQVLIGVLRGVLPTANIQALIVVSVVCVTVCVVRDRREQQLLRVRSVAEAAQSVLLQPLPARTGPLWIASLYIPAEEEAELGGDLYAAARTDRQATLPRLAVHLDAACRWDTSQWRSRPWMWASRSPSRRRRSWAGPLLVHWGARFVKG